MIHVKLSENEPHLSSDSLTPGVEPLGGILVTLLTRRELNVELAVIQNASEVFLTLVF